MKKLAILLSATLLSGCIFVHTPAMNNLELGKVNFDELHDKKMGRSCRTSLFGFIPIRMDDTGIAATAWSAGINNVTYVEHEYTWLLLATQYCVTIFGN